LAGLANPFEVELNSMHLFNFVLARIVVARACGEGFCRREVFCLYSFHDIGVPVSSVIHAMLAASVVTLRLMN